MRNNISRRVMRLEQKAHIHDPPQPVIFVRFVAPGRPHRSSSARCLDSDQAWERRTGETAEAFERRVSEALKRDEQSPSVVLLHPESQGSCRLQLLPNAVGQAVTETDSEADGSSCLSGHSLAESLSDGWKKRHPESCPRVWRW